MSNSIVETFNHPIQTRAKSDAALVKLWLFGKAEHTVRKYTRDYARFEALTRRTLRDVTIEDIQAFMVDISESMPSKASVCSTLAAVKSLLSFAHKVGYTAFNVGAAVNLPKIPDTLNERIISEGEVLAMIHLETKPRNKMILKILYYAGLRNSELASLQWKHISSTGKATGVITVHGKGGKTRNIAIPAHVLESLEAIRSENESPVFVSQKGGHLDTRQINRIVSAAGTRAGVKGDITPHWLRHANASHSIDNGAPISVVRDTLGHASLATTSRYVHAKPNESAGMYLKH